MAKATEARQSALEIMRAIRSGELADRAFARQAALVPPRDVPWLQELVYGTLRLRGRLDFILEKRVAKGLASLDDDVLDILRLAAYQLIEMESVPAYAAVSQAVELTRGARKRSAAGLVNGVLQNLTRSLDEARAVPAAKTADRLSTWGSHPRWLIERWLARFGEEGTSRLVALNNTRPAIYLRRLDASGESFELDGRSVADALADPDVIVQDPAAGLVADYVAAGTGIVADVCAAPGGKALVIAAGLGDRGVVIASDVSLARLARVVENRERVQAANVRVAVADARAPIVRDADVVLIDAPCTGTGTFRRHPDGKWRVSARELQALAELQREILDAASEAVRVGGTLVYATCSLEPEENQEQVIAFLDRHSNFVRRPPAHWSRMKLIDKVGNLVVLPQETGTDGAFAARMERVA